MECLRQRKRAFSMWCRTSFQTLQLQHLLFKTCKPADKNGPDLAGVDHREEMEQQQREGGGGRAATSIAAKKSEQAWSQKRVFSDILFKSALAFNADG
eukprot:4323700-Pleurochrysis_carterae.AAC.1